MFVDIEPIFLVMSKLQITLDTGAATNFLQKHQLTEFLKTQVANESETTKIHDTNDKLLQIIYCTKLFVSVDGMTKVDYLLICERLAVLAILGRNICDQFVVCVYPKTRLVKLVDASAEPML